MNRKKVFGIIINFSQAKCLLLFVNYRNAMAKVP